MLNTLINCTSEAHSSESSDMEIPLSQMDNQTKTSALEGEGNETDFFREKSLYFNPQYSSVKHIKHLSCSLNFKEVITNSIMYNLCINLFQLKSIQMTENPTHHPKT